MGFITFVKPERSYIIQEKSENLFLQFLAKRTVSLDQFQKEQKKKEKIGTNGELTIIEFEKDRLSSDSIYKNHEVKHVSQSNVSAGYDILSWDLEDKKGVVPRYIEVKVVPKHPVQFYFTNNELEKAKLYGNRYYLYLLPLKSKNQFELSQLTIIQDPYIRVFKNLDNWDRQVDTYKFTYNTANEQ
ncbi:protein NO VEIN domain-containing protein [Flagellimonas sp.]